MSAPKDLLGSAMLGAHTSRYGDVVLVAMQGFAFMTLTIEFQQCQQWARSKQSTGAVQKDRMLLLGRIENLIGRVGSGATTKGNNKVLGMIAKVMKQNGMQLEDWSIPRPVIEEVEAKLRSPDFNKKPDEIKPQESKPKPDAG